MAGERFAVRNSGAKAVVEGVGDHGCEYMTGGCVVVLGKTGKNFAAGMSGGVAYVLDLNSDLYKNINKQMVNIERVTSKFEINELKEMIEEHVAYTNSESGKEILDHFTDYLPKFKKIIPIDYEKMLSTIVQMEEQGMSSEQVELKHFTQLKKEEDRGRTTWENQQDLWNMKDRISRQSHRRSESSISANSTHLCQKKNRSAKVQDVWRVAFRSARQDR